MNPFPFNLQQNRLFFVDVLFLLFLLVDVLFLLFLLVDVLAFKIQMMKKFSVVRKKKKKKKSRTLDKWLFGEDLKPEKVDVELELIKADQPVNLEEFIQNPKKTPFLLSFLNGNVYHQVLLFLLEFEQHKVLPLVAREIHMKRIYNKFINPESSTEILSCLKLSGHTVRQMADSSIDSTLEIMAIRAQEILSHDCMPEFRQSPEHLQMLIETQHDRFIPMETLLEVRIIRLIRFVDSY